MFEVAVDCFGWVIAGVGMIEVGQDVPGSAFERPTQRHEFGQAPRYHAEVSVLISTCIRALPRILLGSR